MFSGLEKFQREAVALKSGSIQIKLTSKLQLQRGSHIGNWLRLALGTVQDSRSFQIPFNVDCRVRREKCGLLVA